MPTVEAKAKVKAAVEVPVDVEMGRRSGVRSLGSSRGKLGAGKRFAGDANRMTSTAGSYAAVAVPRSTRTAVDCVSHSMRFA